jgi:hypothetical protein
VHGGERIGELFTAEALRTLRKGFFIKKYSETASKGQGAKRRKNAGDSV